MTGDQSQAANDGESERASRGRTCSCSKSTKRTVAASDSPIRAEAEEVLITPLRRRKKNKTKGKDPFKPGWNLVRSRKKGGANE